MARVALVVAVLLAGRTADARSIAIVPIVASGSVDEEDLFQVGEAVAATLRDRGHDVLGPVEAGERIDERLPGCIASRRPACWIAAARQMARDVVVHGRLHRDAVTLEATLTLTALDGRDGRELVQAVHRLAAPARPSLVGLARTAATHVADDMPALQRHPRLRVETQPSGCELSINGSPVGLSPWSAEVAEGRIMVRARRAGYRTSARAVTVGEGQNRTLTLLLQPGEDGGPGRRARWQLPVGVAGIAVGALGVVAGAWGLARDGCLEDYADGSGCYRRITTGERVGLGAVPLALGVVAAAAGVLVGLVLDLGAEEEPVPPAIAVTR